MTRYADPSRCPDCRALLSPGAMECASCGLHLAGALGQELFATLTRADGILVRMRAESTNAQGPLPAGPSVAAAKRSSTVRRRPSQLPAASVPQVLLTVGALCLLVAAVVFLVVTWETLGVGGRTGVLVALTTVTAALTTWSARRGLRAAVESLGAVTAGLACLDVAGAWSAGWLGGVSESGLAVLLGALLMTGGTTAAKAVERTPAGRFRIGELAVVVGVGSFTLGLAGQQWPAPTARMLVATAVAAAVGTALATVRHLRLPVAAAGTGGLAALSWLGTVAVAVDRLGPTPTMSDAWLHGQGWPLLGAAALPAAVAGVHRLPAPVRVAGAGAALLGLAAFLSCPAWDEPATVVTIVAVAATLVAGAVLLAAPRPWAAAGLGLGTLGASIVGARTLELVEVATDRLANAVDMSWRGTPGGPLPADPGPVSGGWVLPLCVAALALLALGLVRLATGRPGSQQPAGSGLGARVAGRGRLLAVPALAAAALVATATLALGVVPVWTIVAVPLTAAVAGGLVALRAEHPAPAASAAVLLLVGVPVAAYDEVLFALALTVTLLLSTALHVGSSNRAVRDCSGAVAPTTLAGLVWTCGVLSGMPRPWTALTALLLLGAVLLGRAVAAAGRAAAGSVPVELGCAPAAALVSVLGVQELPDIDGWLAVYLTLSGAAVSALALLREDRREVAWLGGLLLATASWVRLADLGVTAPEPYTIPTASALLLVGWARLRRDPRVTTLAALAPGLGLALVPSLLWAWTDPVSVRALVLGTVCLTLVLAGLAGRWSALVLWGATVGAVLVVREAAPYVGHSVPRWVVIGGAGALLTALGLTWERRVAEARAVGAYLRELR